MKDINRIFDTFEQALQEIYDYFGYEETFEAYPIDFSRNKWWYIDRDMVRCFDSEEAYITQDELHSYSSEIIKNTPYSVYVGKEYTMILVDTHTDGNKFLQIFDNAKKLR